jgi:hypothetical protein
MSQNQSQINEMDFGGSLDIKNDIISIDIKIYESLRLYAPRKTNEIDSLFLFTYMHAR